MANEPVTIRRRSDSLIEGVQGTDDGAAYVAPQIGGRAVAATNPMPVEITNPTTGASIGTEDNPLPVENRSPQIRAATEWGRWINDIAPGVGPTVLTNGPAGDQPGIYYNLAVGEVVYVSHLAYALHTLNDEIDLELGWTDAANGGGTFHPITNEWHLATGNVQSGSVTPEVEFSTPIRLRYSDGVRSITVRVSCNDAGATLTCGFQGWSE